MWTPKPKYRYILGDVQPWSFNNPVQWREVIVSIGRTNTFGRAVQRIVLPEPEAKRMVRVMSSDLY